MNRDERENEFDELFVPVDAQPKPLPRGLTLSPSRFPTPTATSPEGLLCVGGRLAPDWLLDAYRHAIFPWPMWANEPIAWWSPDPRAIIELDGLHVSRRLQRTMRSGRFLITFDQDFAGVIRGCATAGDRTNNTWLTPAMIDAYCRMHELGHAHSVEVWAAPHPLGKAYSNHPLPEGKACSIHPLPLGEASPSLPLPLGEASPSLPLPQGEGRGEGALNGPSPSTFTPEKTLALVGGTYGIAIGGLFAAESMFHRARDASKTAVVHLVNHLRTRGFVLLDIQQWTPHTGTMGAVEISRDQYLQRLANAIELPITF